MMVIKQVELCDICVKRPAKFQCDVCGRATCSSHIYKFSAGFYYVRDSGGYYHSVEQIAVEKIDVCKICRDGVFNKKKPIDFSPLKSDAGSIKGKVVLFLQRELNVAKKKTEEKELKKGKEGAEIIEHF